MASATLHDLFTNVYSFFNKLCRSIDDDKLRDLVYRAVIDQWYTGKPFLEFCIDIGGEDLCIVYHVIAYSLQKREDIVYRPLYIRLLVSKDKPLDEVMVFSPYIIEIEGFYGDRVSVVLELSSLKLLYRLYGSRDCRGYRYSLYSEPHGGLWIE